jgi:acetylornithine/N-succinyldiaminopimelate aminotransferase
MASKTCCDVLTPGTHATTFGGSPTVCAAANAVLSVVTGADFLNEVKEKGEYLKHRILELESPNIEGVRGMGLMLGVIVQEGKHTEYVNRLREHGVLALTAGKNAVRLLPPLTITYEELDEALHIMRGVF